VLLRCSQIHQTGQDNRCNRHTRKILLADSIGETMSQHTRTALLLADTSRCRSVGHHCNTDRLTITIYINYICSTVQ